MKMVYSNIAKEKEIRKPEWGKTTTGGR